MKTIFLVTLAATFAFSMTAHSQSIFQQYEAYESACANFIASRGYSREDWFFEHIRRMCLESALDDPAFVTEWLPKKQQSALDRAIQECRARAKSLGSCLELERQRIEKLGQH